MSRRNLLPWVSTPLILLACFLAWDLFVRVYDISELVLPPPLTVGDDPPRGGRRPGDVGARPGHRHRDDRRIPHRGGHGGARRGRARQGAVAGAQPAAGARRVAGRPQGGPDPAVRHLVRLRDHLEGDHVGDARVLPDHAERAAGRPFGRARASATSCAASTPARWDTFRHLELHEHAAVRLRRDGGRDRLRDHRRRSSASTWAATRGSATSSCARLNELDAPALFAVIILLSVLGLLLYAVVNSHEAVRHPVARVGLRAAGRERMTDFRSNLPVGSPRWATRRAQWRALGLTDEDLVKPKIAIVNSSSGLAPCFSHLDPIAAAGEGVDPGRGRRRRSRSARSRRPTSS